MADNVVFTVATDEVNINGTNAQVQYVKLADGTNNSNAVISGDTLYGLDVDVTRINGTVNVNIVGGSSAGIQYTGGTTLGLPTGNLMFGVNSSNYLQPLKLNANNYLIISGDSNSYQAGTWNINSITTLPNITLASQASPFTTALNTSGWFILKDSLGNSVTTTSVSSQRALDVNVVQTVGSSSSSINYVEGDTASVITGQVLLAESPGNIIKPLQLNSSSALNITGDVNIVNALSVTANAGTNLNTSALALETTVSSIKTAVETIDNAIAGNEMQVDIVSAPTLTVQSTDLDIRNLSQTQDAILIYGSDDGGTTKRVIKTDSGGAIQVDLEVASVTVSSGAITETNSAAIKTSVELIDDAIYTDGSGTPSKAIGIAGTDGTNPQIIKTDSNGELQVDVLSMPTTTVQATNLDIRDLTSVSDSVSAVQSGTWNINDVSGAISLPTGASTSANQSTIIGHLDGVETVLGTIDTDTGNISTKIDTIAGAISGTEMQVDVLTLPNVNLAAGTNNIGDVDIASIAAGDNLVGRVKISDGTTVATVRDLASNDALNVAIVDGSGNQVTSFGGGTQYTEGDTDASITGTAMLMEVAANALQPVQGTVADGLLVNLGSNNDVVVSATNLDIRDLTSGSDSVAAVQSGTWNITDISGTVSLPTGAATSANQSTIIGHLDGVESLLTTIDADTGNISTKIDTIAGAVSGTEVQVDVITLPNVTIGSALPAGTNNIGIVSPFASTSNFVQGTGSKTDTSNLEVIAAQGVSDRIYLTSISIANSSATNVIIEIKDGSTVIWRTAAPANGGSNITFPIPLKLSLNTALNMASLTSATTIYFSANGYKGA